MGPNPRHCTWLRFGAALAVVLLAFAASSAAQAQNKINEIYPNPPGTETGFDEMVRSFSKKAFVKALAKLVPEIRESDVKPGGSGVRAQALSPSGNLIDDFLIAERPRALHVLNAPSPAATASLAIAEEIARRYAERA